MGIDISWVTKNNNNFLLDGLNAFFDFISSSLVKMFDFGTSICQTKSVLNATQATTTIGTSLVIVFLLKEIFNTYILETDGDSDSDPMQVLVRGSVTIAAICCQSWVFSFLSKASSAFTQDIAGAIDISAFEKKFTSALTLVANLLINPLVMILFLIFALAIIIMLCFKAVLRGAELSLCRILFPLFAVDLLTTSKERFNSFFTTYMVNFFGYSLQIFCFQMGLSGFVDAISGAGGLSTTFENYSISIAWMWFATKTPKWLEKFAYSSGLKNTVSGAGRGLMSGAMMLRYMK